MSIKDRVALVTGGGRGVGKGISLSLAAAGASVAVNYRRDEESAAETVREIEALGGKAIAFSASVDDYEQNAQMVADIERDLGPSPYSLITLVLRVVGGLWWTQIPKR